MGKLLCTLALVCASLGLSVPRANASINPQPANAKPAPLNPIIEWNRTLLVIVRTPGAQPPTIHSTRSFAILHAAMFDAVNNIAARYAPYLVRLGDVSRKASQAAAADQSAHDVLVSLYPSFQPTLDGELQQDLAQIPDGKDKTDGIAVGQAVAAQILAFRSNDGSGVTPPPYVPGDQPGDYQLTPPNFAPADFTHWPKVTPFALPRANVFLPGPPPVLTSDAYAATFNEVKSLGFINSTNRTPGQTEIGKFWNGNIQDFWNEIAQSATLEHKLNLVESARVFALLNISLADTAIAFFDAKYTYNFWRPVTAIQKADTDGNPNTDPDPNWLPLPTKTAPDPSYPGAHSAVSAAGAEVLRSVLGDEFAFDLTSESLPDVVRHFDSFSQAAQEAGLSRIFAGQHFRIDHVSGKSLGRKVGQFVVETMLLAK